MKPVLRAVLVALVVCAGVVGCNDDQLPPAAGYASVSGTVVDAVTSKPVAGAVITIDTVLTATTDASGKFTIAKVPSGIVDYTVQATGYKLASSTTNVEPSKPFELDVTLSADPNSH
ncbi:MAG TPA: carboxypeptidase-like regulatory domain-containing protein [Candidatus Acidoferrales bacterium]|nr:carboxypeptidase-like regulatory domain-containing protein [Candidatus Acidoferrales bacterium]